MLTISNLCSFQNQIMPTILERFKLFIFKRALNTFNNLKLSKLNSNLTKVLVKMKRVLVLIHFSNTFFSLNIQVILCKRFNWKLINVWRVIRTSSKKGSRKFKKKLVWSDAKWIFFLNKERNMWFKKIWKIYQRMPNK